MGFFFLSKTECGRMMTLKKRKEERLMNTIRFEKEDLEAVVELLKEGNVVAFPTDTVYGLGVIYENEEALDQKISQFQRWWQVLNK